MSEKKSKWKRLTESRSVSRRRGRIRHYLALLGDEWLVGKFYRAGLCDDLIYKQFLLAAVITKRFFAVQKLVKYDPH